MDGNRVGNMERHDAARHSDGTGLLVDLLAVDMPDFDHVAQLFVEVLVGAVEVGRDPAHLAFVFAGALHPVLIPAFDHTALAEFDLGEEFPAGHEGGALQAESLDREDDVLKGFQRGPHRLVLKDVRAVPFDDALLA